MLKINTYEVNYWSSYFDFIDGFKALNYDGYSFPLLSHYYGLINDNKEIISKLKDESLSRLLINRIRNKKEIQIKFDTYLNSIKYERKNREEEGLVVLHDKLLRFSNDILKAFETSETILLKRGSIHNNANKGISIHTLLNYSGDTNTQSRYFLEQAAQTFLAYEEHPIFNNRKFQKRFLQELPLIVNNIIAARKFMEKIPVSCIVLGGTNNPESRSLAFAAREKGIPSVCLQHGIIGLEFGYLPKVSTVQAVYGQYEFDWYKQRGIPESSIKIIGHPRFDEINTRKQMSRYGFEKLAGLDPDKISILLVLHHQETEITSFIIKELLKNHQVNIIVRSRHNARNIHRLKKNFPTIRHSNNVHLYDLIHNVDAVVSYPSTVALEAMLAGKPVFIWKINADSSTGYFNNMDDFIQSDPAKLVDIIGKFLNRAEIHPSIEQKRKEFISYCYPNTNELSVNRLKKLIASLLINNEEIT